MKRHIKILLASFVLMVQAMFLVPQPALAVDVFTNCNGAAAQSTVCQERGNGENPITGPNGLLTKGIQVMALITGVASIIMMIYGGMRYVLSNGDTNAANSGRSMVIYSAIGLVVAMVAQALVIFVLNNI